MGLILMGFPMDQEPMRVESISTEILLTTATLREATVTTKSSIPIFRLAAGMLFQDQNVKLRQLPFVRNTEKMRILTHSLAASISSRMEFVMAGLRRHGKISDFRRF
ncbi:hypothetical protein AEQ67_18770 [Pseudomonas sp. RIT-PI-q]|nr:hypothetical protein AEQ67_18770 [Pseudomonas sp. RIT-PI-q]